MRNENLFRIQTVFFIGSVVYWHQRLIIDGKMFTVRLHSPWWSCRAVVNDFTLLSNHLDFEVFFISSHNFRDTTRNVYCFWQPVETAWPLNVCNCCEYPHERWHLLKSGPKSIIVFFFVILYCTKNLTFPVLGIVDKLLKSRKIIRLTCESSNCFVSCNQTDLQISIPFSVFHNEIST